MRNLTTKKKEKQYQVKKCIIIYLFLVSLFVKISSSSIDLADSSYAARAPQERGRLFPRPTRLRHGYPLRTTYQYDPRCATRECPRKRTLLRRSLQSRTKLQSRKKKGLTGTALQSAATQSVTSLRCKAGFLGSRQQTSFAASALCTPLYTYERCMQCAKAISKIQR